MDISATSSHKRSRALGDSDGVGSVPDQRSAGRRRTCCCACRRRRGKVLGADHSTEEHVKDMGIIGSGSPACSRRQASLPPSPLRYLLIQDDAELKELGVTPTRIPGQSQALTSDHTGRDLSSGPCLEPANDEMSTSTESDSCGFLFASDF